MNKDTPLTERQMAILDAIKDGCEYTNATLIIKMGLDKSGQTQSKISWNVDRLKMRGMIDTWPAGNSRAYAINQSGKTALRERLAEMRLYSDAAPPVSRGLLMDRPVYVPPKAYYRNAGHGHIPSRGIGA